jgi:hypothetical protein
MQKSSLKTCRQCGKTINPTKGRSDRIYCDEKCKNQFHNTKAIEENAELQRIELILKKNRRILKKMFLKKERAEIKKEKLLKEGFDFEFHTHHVTSKIKKNEFIFCFDFGYRSINADSFKIVKAFDYKEE